MNVEAINAAGLVDAIMPKGQAAVSPPSFAAHIAAEFESVNSKIVQAEGQLQELAAGNQTNLHHVMLSLEEAKLSFQLLVQVRNKVLEGYQELMRMQV